MRIELAARAQILLLSRAAQVTSGELDMPVKVSREMSSVMSMRLRGALAHAETLKLKGVAVQQAGMGSTMASRSASPFAPASGSGFASGSIWFAMGPLKPQLANKSKHARRIGPNLTPGRGNLLGNVLTGSEKGGP